jgi:site-specific DNA-methyltransferase (adenine-specific)
MIELLNIDCMEYMSTLQDNAFDLAIVDPPYGIGQDGKSNNSRCSKANGKILEATQFENKFWDRKPADKTYFNELRRVSKNQIIWGANHFISRNPIDSSCWIVWNKETSGDFADCELAWTSFKTAVRMITYCWNGYQQGPTKQSIEKRIHPTQKPIQLYNWLLHYYAKSGQRVLDTHLGSGSSAIAAHYFNVDFVGCEIDEDYFKAAQKRFSQATAQKTLFDEVA